MGIKNREKLLTLEPIKKTRKTPKKLVRAEMKL